MESIPPHLIWERTYTAHLDQWNKSEAGGAKQQITVRRLTINWVWSAVLENFNPTIALSPRFLLLRVLDKGELWN